MGTLLIVLGTKEKTWNILLAERDGSGRTITLIPGYQDKFQQIATSSYKILQDLTPIFDCQLTWLTWIAHPPPIIPSSFSEVYEELLRPFGGRIPKRVKTQVAAAAELGDVKAALGKKRVTTQ